MKSNRTQKRRYNGGDDRHAFEKSSADIECEKQKQVENAMEKRAESIAFTVTEMFKFMSLSAALLPNMELDAGIMRLKVDNNEIFFGITYPESHRRNVCDCRKNNDDDEEGLLYDGD